MPGLSLLDYGNITPADATLNAPRLHIEDGATVGDGIARAGRAIGGGLQDYGQSMAQTEQFLADADQKFRDAANRILITEKGTESLVTQQQAMEATATVDNPDTAKAMVADRFKPLFDQLDDIADPQVRATLKARLTERQIITSNEAASRAESRAESRIKATVADQQSQAVAGVTAGRVDLVDALTQNHETVALNAPLLGPVYSQKLIASFETEAVKAEFFRRLSVDPASAKALLDTELGRRAIEPMQADSFRTHADQVQNKRENEQVVRTHQDIAKWVAEQTAPDQLPPDPQALADKTTLAAELIHILDPNIDIDRTRYAMLEPALTAAATAVDADGNPAPDFLRFNAIAQAMPRTPETEERKNTLKAQMNAAQQRAEKADTEAVQLQKLYLSKSAIPEGTHFSPAAMKKLYETNDPLEVIRYFQAHDLPMPDAVVKDIASDFDPLSANLPNGLAKLETIGGDRAKQIAESAGRGAPVAKLLWSSTRDAAPEERAAILELLSKPAALQAITDADHALTGPKNKKDPVHRVAALPNLSTEQLTEFNAHFRLAFAERRIAYNDARSIDEVAVQARAVAEAKFAERHIRMISPNVGDVWVLRSIVGNNAQPLQNAINRYGEDLDPWNPFNRGDVFMRPEMVFRDGGMIYVPAVGSSDAAGFLDATNPVKGFLKFDPATGQSVKIENKPATPADTKAEFDRINGVFTHHTPKDSLAPMAALRWQPEFGPVTITQYDARFTDPKQGYGYRLKKEIVKRLKDAGVLDGLSPEQQMQMLNDTSEREARALNWPGFFGPTEGEATQ